MKLVERTVQSFRVAKVFKENPDQIKCIDFSSTGQKMVCCTHNLIELYDSDKGVQVGTVHSRKYGVDLIRFVQQEHTAIHTSIKVDHSIRHLSLHDNRYIRYFPGHRQRVLSLCVSSEKGTFLSASLDQTLRLWDLRSENCQGMLHLPGLQAAAYDPQGLIFAAGINSEMLKLYDLRSFDKGPFATFTLSKQEECDWTGLKFSEDGKFILISTNGSIIRTVNAFHGTPLNTFSGCLNDKGIPIEASFSPDSQFIFRGSTDDQVHVWNSNTGNKVCTLNQNHGDLVQYVEFNPKSMMLATAGTKIAFWLPSIEDT